MTTLDRVELVVQPTTQGAPVSRTKVWAARIIRGLIVLFLVFDGVGKFFMPAPVVEAFARLGFPVGLAAVIGTILLVCTVLYVIPRTSTLGAILLTGYLGGAVASQLRIGEPLFSHVLFPVYFGVLIWAGLYLREDRLHEFIFPGS